MSLKINDSDEQRLIDRIKCIAFKEAKESGAEFITRKWIADKLKRSEKWVQRNWNDWKSMFLGFWKVFEVFVNNVREVLISLENKTELFENLLLSYSDRLKALIEAQGSHTDYWNF